MAEKTPTDVNLALACMRSALDWKQSELAEAADERATNIPDPRKSHECIFHFSQAGCDLPLQPKQSESVKLIVEPYCQLLNFG